MIKKNTVFRRNIRILSQFFLILAVGAFSIPVLASNFQNFSSLCYSNPAELPFLIQNFQFILGDTWAYPEITFHGMVIVPPPRAIFNPVVSTGSSSTIEGYDLPYGRVAQRIAGGLVANVDVTEPFKKDIVYATDSPVRYSATVSRVHSENIAPSLSYKFSSGNPLENLSVAGGLDALHFYVELDQEYPSLPRVLPGPTVVPFGVGPDANVTERGSAWAYGWHVATEYHLFKGTFTGLSYYSQITPNTSGPSTFTGYPNTTLSATANLPATTNFDITQFFSPTCLVRLQLHYTQWDRLKEVILQNTAGPTNNQVIPTNYNNTWRVDLGTRFDAGPKVILGALLAFEQTPTNNTDRTVRLPEGNEIIAGASLGYRFTKKLVIEGNYSHLFTVTRVPINNVMPGAGITTIGDADVSGNSVGAKLTYNT